MNAEHEMATATRITPGRLVERFCQNVEPGLVAGAGTHGNLSRGFCGYVGGHGDALSTGLDDGAVFMDVLASAGWVFIPEGGQWPYIVNMVYADEAAGAYAIASYEEGDLNVWRFQRLPALRGAVDQLRGIDDVDDDVAEEHRAMMAGEL